MRIAKLVLRHVRIPLKKTIRHASHSRNDTESLVVGCELTDGTVGWGEGLPREYVTGENIDAAWQLLLDADFPRLLGGTLENLRATIERLSEFRLTQTPHGSRECFGHSARCAVELAVLDACCRAEEQPLSAVTAMLPETATVRQAVDDVRYSAAITSESPRKQFVQALKLKLFGFHQVKVKVGVPEIDDAQLLKRARRVLGRNVDLRIDANEAWSCENLPEKLAPLDGFRITSVEQPVPHADVAGLASVRPQMSIPLMLDESLCGYDDGQRAVEHGLCDLFNIRLSKCGGFLPSLKLALLAKSSGLGYQLGCQVGETGILSAAGRHFASSVSDIRYLEGSYDRFLVRERLTQEDLTFGYGGKAPALAKPGLGVTVDPAALERVTVRRQDVAL